jgi:signal transduction histidine kinase
MPTTDQPKSIRATLSRHGEAVCAALDHLGVAAAQVALDGTWATVNGRFCQVMERTADEIRATPLADLLHIDRAVLDSAASGARSAESQITRKDARVAWIKAGLSPVRDPTTDRVGSLILVIEDITTREASERRLLSSSTGKEVAGRLINALEVERSRIARELHDDIGQSLAVLVVEMLRAGKPVSGQPGRRHPDVPELSARVQGIAARVGRLSHELHSSRLEYLGLEKAIRAACREFSDGHKIAVECTCEQVPAQLDSGVGLCLLRVVQEALHNVAKHSRATKVGVTLTGRPDRLALAVTDDGVGFDVSEAGLAEGIGLISMRERVCFVGGTFNLSSTPGRGTHLEAHVPIPRE